ncbi:MAG: transposase [Bryobacterales bacterium]|nr:transposase [Bryobacterales bacterium]
MLIGEENRGTEGDGGVVRRRRRRRWSEAQKRQIVAETHEPGVSVPMVAQRYNLNANQVFRWRRLSRELERAGGAGRFVPVVVEGAPGHEAGAAAMSPRSDDDVAVGVPATGRIEIVLAGDRRGIVDRAVDSSALARVITVLERR